MTRFRPRISLLNALLVTAVTALTIVVVRQQREFLMLRYDWDQLPGHYKAPPQFWDEKKLHARCSVDIQALLWTWRLWVPKEATFVVRFKCGDIPAEGYPADDFSFDVAGGHNWIGLQLLRPTPDGVQLGELMAADLVHPFLVPKGEAISPWYKPEYETDRVGVATFQEGDDGRLVLQRFRVVADDAPADATAPGFMVWLERQTDR